MVRPFIVRTLLSTLLRYGKVDQGLKSSFPYRKLRLIKLRHLAGAFRFTRAFVITYSAVVTNDNKSSRMCRRVDSWFLSVLSSHMWPRKIVIFPAVYRTLLETGPAEFLDYVLKVLPK